MTKVRMLVSMAGEYDGEPIAWAAGDVVDVSSAMAKALCEIALDDGSFRAEEMGARTGPAAKRSRAVVEPSETR